MQLQDVSAPRQQELSLGCSCLQFLDIQRDKHDGNHGTIQEAPEAEARMLFGT